MFYYPFSINTLAYKKIYMASIRFLLGMLPETAKYEQRETQLRKDYEAFNNFAVSEDLKHYENLEKEVNSPEFRMKIKEIKSLKYKNTEEYRKEHEYIRLKKSKPVTNYFTVLNSDKLREYESFKKSKELKRYLEWKDYVMSDAFIKEKASLSSSEYKNSEAGLKEKEYKEASGSTAIVNHFKFENSSEYRDYIRFSESDELKKYNELEKFVNSDEFAKVKNYMNLSPKEKYESSDEFKKVQEYEILRKSDRIIWYYKTRKKYPFRYVEKWELSFEDTFEGGKLDSKKWITRYLHGDKTFHKNYVMADDRHAFTDGKNLEFFDKKIRIITKREQGSTLVWDAQRGFYEKEFGFTSDLISSGNNFRQKYGLYEAKVKIAPTGVTQSFSMLADRILPHVDVFKFEKNKLNAGNFWNNGYDKGFSKSVSKSSGSRYSKDFFIYSLEWLPGKITWKINGEVFKVQSQGLPDEPLYLMFNSSLKEKANHEGLPSAMEIDWVRVYKPRD